MSKLKVIEIPNEDLIFDADDLSYFIGTGGYADIFKGLYKNKCPVAIKCLKKKKYFNYC